MNELFPIASGVLLAVLLLRLRPELRPRVGVAAALLCGLAATLTSREFQLSWAYVLVDAALVAGAALATLAVLRRLELRLRA